MGHFWVEFFIHQMVTYLRQNNLITISSCGPNQNTIFNFVLVILLKHDICLLMHCLSLGLRWLFLDLDCVINRTYYDVGLLFFYQVFFWYQVTDNPKVVNGVADGVVRCDTADVGLSVCSKENRGNVIGVDLFWIIFHNFIEFPRIAW